MDTLDAMWGRLSALVFVAAATVFLGACGSDGNEPKRTLDARAEAIRFFAPDTPFLALVDPTPAGSGNAGETLSSLSGEAAVTAFADNDLGFITDQGISTAQLAPLLTATDPTLESEDSRIAVGVKPSQPDEDPL